jgi:hypothetical protein
MIVLYSVDKKDLQKDVAKYLKENPNAKAGNIIKKGKWFEITIIK